MTISFLNRCIWNSLTQGLSDFHVGSAANNGYTPAQALDPTVVDGGTYHYFAQSADGTQHEEGDGVFTVATTTLTRATIRNSSASDTKVNFASPPIVFMGGPTANDMGGGGMAIGGTVTSGTAGSILFVGSGPVLAQDNANFAWDDTNDILKIQGKNAIFRVPNGSGDNWFEGGAGNTSVTGNTNFGTGTDCLLNVTSGSGNVGVGANALKVLTTANNNFAFGLNALASVNNDSNTAIGPFALSNCTSGHDNVAIGNLTMSQATSSVNCIAIGSSALLNSQIGTLNIAIASGALLTLGNTATNDIWNIAIGGNGFRVLSTGSQNTSLGTLAGEAITSGNTNTLIGFSAASSVTSGSNNTLLGTWSGPSGPLSNVIAFSDGNGTLLQDYNYTKSSVWSFNTMELDLVVSGTSKQAIYVVPNASGDNWFEGGAGNTSVSGNSNFGTGTSCLAAVTSGFFNTALGAGALQTLQTGSHNLAIGAAALISTVNGQFNVALGDETLAANVSDFNIAIGGGALQNSVNGQRNIGIGASSLLGLTTTADINNIVIGASAGKFLPTASYNTVIGADALGTLAADASNNVLIGYGCLHSATATCETNTFVGVDAGYNLAQATNSTIIGVWTGPVSGTINGIIGIADGTNSGNFNLDRNYTHAATWTFDVAYMVTPVAVGSLPSAGIKGRRHFVTDATATTFASIVAGSGTNGVPVYDDGTNWRIG